MQMHGAGLSLHTRPSGSTLQPLPACLMGALLLLLFSTAVQVREIATIKLPDLNCTDLEAACNTVMGTARNMGITVEA